MARGDVVDVIVQEVDKARGRIGLKLVAKHENGGLVQPEELIERAKDAPPRPPEEDAAAPRRPPRRPRRLGARHGPTTVAAGASRARRHGLTPVPRKGDVKNVAKRLTRRLAIADDSGWRLGRLPLPCHAPSNPPISPLRGLLEVTRLLGAEEELPRASVRDRADGRGVARLRDRRDQPLPARVGRLLRHDGRTGSEARARGAARPRPRRLRVGRRPRRSLPAARRVLHPARRGRLGGARRELRADRKPGTGADAWHPEDALFVPLRHSDGHLLGILSVDEPNSGLARRRRGARRARGALRARRARGAGGAGDRGRGAPPARARGAARRFVARSPPSRPSTRFSARCAAASATRSVSSTSPRSSSTSRSRGSSRARRRRLGARGSARDRRRRARRRRAAARLGVRDRRLLPAPERRGAQADPRRRGQLRLAFQRARPARMGPALAARPAARRRGRPDRTDLGRRARRPAAPVRGAAAGAAHLREPGRRRDRLRRAPAGAALPRRPRSADAAAQPPRVRRPARRRGRACNGYGRSFALVLCDLDGFKELNDRYGHSVGDEALRDLRRDARQARCAAATRRSASAATSSRCCSPRRREHDARAVVGRAATSSRPAGLTAESMRASYGVASCPADATDAQTLFRLADEALYLAKRNRSGVQFAASRSAGIVPAWSVTARSSS